MLLGIVLSIIAGMAMSVQGVMNTRLGEGIGNMEADDATLMRALEGRRDI